MTTRESYRTLNSESDWAFFDLDLYGASEARAATHALDINSAEAFWKTHISAIGKERHPMLLPASHWLRATAVGPDWVAEFNSTSSETSPSSGAVACFLRDHFSLSENELVYMVLMREHSYVTPWRVALIFWPGLLAIDDEGPFIFHVASGKFAHFGPNGSLDFGIKTPSQPNAA
jgi:hypothetical protein